MTRTRRALAAGTTLALAGTGLTALVVTAGPAAAAVPAFPDNIIVFPERDYVSVEGYQSHVGETATLTVTRGGSVVGAAKGTIQAGDVALDVNHPGGVCWGAGTNLAVTPDIRAGDVVGIAFGGDPAGETTVLDGAVDAAPALSGSTLTVTGHLGPDVDPAQAEQRIVNPDLVPLVGRRDVRAVPGPVTRAPKGGYTSGLTMSGTSFTATYVFDSGTAATAAAKGLPELMAWQATDGVGNAQGLTTSEYGEAGGPGMGGCPAGPGTQAAPAPGTATVVRSSSDPTRLTVSWTPATPQPGAAAVTGYDVEALGADVAGVRPTTGARTGASATRVTLTGLDAAAAYDVEVRALAGARASEPFTVAAPAPAPPPPGDTTVPAVTATPAPGTQDAPATASSVTLTSESGADVYVTTDGSPAVEAGLPADGARLVTGPVAVTAAVELHWVAFDRAGNYTTGEGWYAPPALAVPAAPALGTSTAGQESLTLTWSAPSGPVTEYEVTLYEGTTDTVVGTGSRTTTATSLVVTGLVADKGYTFTVLARNAAGDGPASVRSAVLTPTAVTDTVTIASARWKSGDFRVSGSGSAVGATVTVRQGSATGTVLGTGTVVAAAAPATGGSYDLRFRSTAAPTKNPGTIYVTSDKKGTAGPFTVTAG